MFKHLVFIKTAVYYILNLFFYFLKYSNRELLLYRIKLKLYSIKTVKCAKWCLHSAKKTKKTLVTILELHWRFFHRCKLSVTFSLHSTNIDHPPHMVNFIHFILVLQPVTLCLSKGRMPSAKLCTVETSEVPEIFNSLFIFAISAFSPYLLSLK